MKHPQASTLTRRRLLGATAITAAVPFTVVMPAAEAQQLSLAYTTQQYVNPGAALQLPSGLGSIGVADCATLRQLSQSYRAACTNIENDPALLAEVQERLRVLTQEEVYKLQKSVDLADGKVLAEWINIADVLIGAIIAAVSLVALAIGANILASGAAAAGLIYGIGVSPTVQIVKSAVASSGGDILWTWTRGRAKTIGIEAAKQYLTTTGKKALEAVGSFFLDLVEVFNGVAAVAEGLGNLDELERKTQAAAARALDIRTKFQGLLQNPDDVLNLVCGAAKGTADALDAYIDANSASDCRPSTVDLRVIEIKHDGGTIVLP